ncbi:coniferyl aldehyde dehydrogenase [Variovorax saccharolyticus]|uniref:coniferyl aldehyde dehydrogenase n=1 Tax=Variovorax saccharolyticus TaxID=3053516 RepID=UPI00257828B0|nr:coniferyl aldehyde dehydrogenase [Variovorax sp. J31P216]MDM0028232.1 coniferyl aldehyde dehydrogenase [Variovorax sp. J31P216]
MTTALLSDAAIDALHRTLALQRQAFQAAPFPSLADRRRDLKALRLALQRWQDPLARAMSEDFGRRSESECKMLDVLGPALQIDHALAHLRRWMRSERRGVDWMFLGNRARVVYQPKGVVGVIAAWNFPVVESVGPLVTAIAAGNRVMIKMSEFSPRCTEVLRRMLAEVFAADQVAVFDGGVEVGRAFAGLPLDHVVFTGSPAVGREIMRAASVNLTPVTLELGGKSPAIVGRSAAMGTVARSIAHGKLFNSGQACVAPDYALVPPERIAEFVAATVREFQRMVPDPVQDPHYTSMASERHADRVRELLVDAVAKGASVTSCGAGDGGRIIPLQIVTGVSPQMRIMQEELFNPILPVLACDSIDEAVAFVTARPRPLALYYYGNDSGEARRLTRDVPAGGMTINDWAWHVFQCDLPFGGSGNSGMGSWRGPEGFRALSHAKSVFTVRRWFPIHLFRPPYGSHIQQLIMKQFLGHGAAGHAELTAGAPSEPPPVQKQGPAR